jgi:Ca2+-binding RTX toxin-like protein
LSDGSVLLANASATAASMSGTANNDQIIAGTGGDTLSGLAGDDKITGGDGADSISGGDGADSVVAGEGNDTIDGGDGANTLSGGNSADSIIGGVDADSITGGNGNDTLEGDTGADTLTGGNENDTFAYAVATVDATDTNVDLITDAFTGSDKFDFTDLTNANLRGTGVTFASGSASGAQALGANVGLYVATNAAADFTEANIYAALAGIADDLAASDKFYVLISNGTDARLALITEAANAGTLVAVDDTLEFVTRLSGVTNAELADLVAGNFVDFS